MKCFEYTLNFMGVYFNAVIHVHTLISSAI